MTIKEVSEKILNEQNIFNDEMMAAFPEDCDAPATKGDIGQLAHALSGVLTAMREAFAEYLENETRN